jgi:hypothetical protein
MRALGRTRYISENEIIWDGFMKGVEAFVVDGVSKTEGLSRAAALSAMNLPFQLIKLMLTAYCPPTERIPVRINVPFKDLPVNKRHCTWTRQSLRSENTSKVG